MKKKIYKTVISYTILSEEPYFDMRLSDIIYNCEEGSFIGGKFMTTTINDELIGENAVNEIKELGSMPDFFMMDDDGEEIEE